jgi:hypothetical protein
MAELEHQQKMIWEALFNIAEACDIDVGDDPEKDLVYRDECQEFLLTSIAYHIRASLRALQQARSRVGTNDEREGDKGFITEPPVEVVANSMLFGVRRKPKAKSAKAGK